MLTLYISMLFPVRIQGSKKTYSFSFGLAVLTFFLLRATACVLVYVLVTSLLTLWAIEFSKLLTQQKNLLVPDYRKRAWITLSGHISHTSSSETQGQSVGPG